jgi:hypothetical protein
MEMVAIVAHVPLRAEAGIRVQTAAAVGIPLRGAVGIQVPIVAVVDIPLRAAAGAAGIQLPVAVEVAVGSTPPAVTTGPIADNKNLKYFRAAPQAAPFFVSLRIVVCERRANVTLACSDKNRFVALHRCRFDGSYF